LKYKRSNELRTFFESRYQNQSKQVKECQKKSEILQETIAAKDNEIMELRNKVLQL